MEACKRIALKAPRYPNMQVQVMAHHVAKLRDFLLGMELAALTKQYLPKGSKTADARHIIISARAKFYAVAQERHHFLCANAEVRSLVKLTGHSGSP